MRIVLSEIKKIWNIKAALSALILCGIFYAVFLAPYILSFPQSQSKAANGMRFQYAKEITERYGTELDETELTEFLEKRGVLLREAAEYIQASPAFAKYGVSDFRGLVAAVEALAPYGGFRQSEEELDELYEQVYQRFSGGEISQLDFLEELYYRYRKKMETVITDDKTDENIRNRFIRIRDDNAYFSVIDVYSFGVTQGYFVNAAILIVLAVLLMVSPLIINDRIRGVYYLQYSMKQGRKTLGKQLAAIMISTFALTSILVAVLMALFSTTGIMQIFWNNSLVSFYLFLYTPWLNITFGQYIMILVAILYVIAFFTATLAFAISRFSQNWVPLIIKAIVVFAVLTVFCSVAMRDLLLTSNLLYINVVRFVGVEILAPAAFTTLGIAAVLYISNREKRVDVL